MHILITGHTGFKGAWLTFLLKELGHSVSGIALSPRISSIYANSSLSKLLNHEKFVDIRDFAAVFSFIRDTQPDSIMHLAAQPLVRYSYRDPIFTYETNFNGTLNVLQGSVLADIERTLIITTDKVYTDDNRTYGYSETDNLGGFDPYSNSKALADRLTQSFIQKQQGQFFGIARAGNVVGGGDDGMERLVPDLQKAVRHGEPVTLRNPNAVRPWQFVLDCLNGYVNALLRMDKVVSPIWNFGPEKHYSVQTFADKFISGQKSRVEIKYSADLGELKETEVLILNSSKAKNELDWSPKMNLDATVDSIIEWTSNAEQYGFNKATIFQVKKYLELS